MSAYTSEAAANADGIHIEHDERGDRFVLAQIGEGGERNIVGEAHYTLIGDGIIDFDHTFVSPALRGTGLSDLLAHRALTSELVSGKSIRASCWFIAEYLMKHPKLAGDR